MQCWDRSPNFDDVSNGDLQRVYLLAWSNPWAFLRMGACQVNRQSEILFSRRLACQIADTRTHTDTHILCAARGHIPNQVHTRIYTHIAVYWFDMVHRLWWQYQVLVWLRWWRQRQDGGCHLLWVTGSRGGWGGSGEVREWGDSWVHGMQSIPLSGYVFVSRKPPPTPMYDSIICLLCLPVFSNFSVFFLLSVHLSLPLSPPLYPLFFISLHRWGEDEICPLIPVSETASRKTMGYP